MLKQSKSGKDQQHKQGQRSTNKNQKDANRIIRSIQKVS